MSAQAPTDGQEHAHADAATAGATAADVRICYRLFLGREAESDAVVEEKVGESVDALPRVFLSSPEFEDNVFRPLVEGRPWQPELFRTPLDVALLDWIERRFGIAGKRLDEAEDWPALLAMLYGDGRLLRANDGPISAEDHDRFLSGLRGSTARSPAPADAEPLEATDSGSAAGPPEIASDLPRFDLDDRVRILCHDRSVHIVRASFSALERLRLPLEGGCTRLLLSDTPDKGQRCRALAARLRSDFPRADIATRELRYDQYWECRAAPRTDVVLDLGTLIHETAPARHFAHLLPMALKVLGCASMVLPEAVLANRTLPKETILSWHDLRPATKLAKVIDRALQRRGISLPQLRDNGGKSQMMTDVSWLWFPTVDGLIRLAACHGARPLAVGHTWQDIAVWIEFQP